MVVFFFVQMYPHHHRQIPNSPLASVVGVGDSSELLELGLELGVGDTLIDSVDKELAALLSVGGHLVDPSGLSLSLKPNKSDDEGPGCPCNNHTDNMIECATKQRG